MYETKVTPEEEIEALNLGLPPKFFAYRQLPDCSCDQCKKDDDYLKELFLPSIPVSKTSVSNNSIFGTPTSTITPSTGDSIFKTPREMAAFSFSSDTREKNDSLREILLKPSKLNPSPNKDTAVINKPLEMKKAAENVKPFTFSFGHSDTSKNIFSQTSGNIFTGGGLFSIPTTNANLFSSSQSSSGTSLFNKNENGSGIFGSTESNPLLEESNSFSGFGSATSSNSIFNTNTSIFGKNSSNVFQYPNKTTASSLFGTQGSISVTSTSLFGTTKSATVITNSPLYGNVSTTSIFTPNMIGRAENSLSISGSIFGQSSTNSIFSKTNESDSVSQIGCIFESDVGSDSSIFKNKSEHTQANISSENFKKTNKDGLKTTNLKDDDELVLKCTSDLSFAALAANTTEDSKPSFANTGDVILKNLVITKRQKQKYLLKEY